ncbi:hypothetical protein PROFUN_04122 [Planoprotostelium fungivorum]|uniref:Right handed beta helix domain-containing protein n=1 Tax=Planoprotostelium fungivorum TaxID=1890364 RepID=A0A2P6NJK5_9EUKA|nr:hypothetical protein PROFUN_04122 [Planoprotostelium fungivorum]
MEEDNIDGRNLPFNWSHIYFTNCPGLFPSNLSNITINHCIFGKSSMVAEVEGSTASITDNHFYATTLNIISTSENLPGHTIIHDNEIYSSQITATVSSSSGVQSCGISSNYLNTSSVISYLLTTETTANTSITSNCGEHDSGLLLFHSRLTNEEIDYSHFTIYDNIGLGFSLKTRNAR